MRCPETHEQRISSARSAPPATAITTDAHEPPPKASRSSIVRAAIADGTCCFAEDRPLRMSLPMCTLTTLPSAESDPLMARPRAARPSPPVRATRSDPARSAKVRRAVAPFSFFRNTRTRQCDRLERSFRKCAPDVRVASTDRANPSQGLGRV